ncbi:MAG: GntR family transcriptional regulator [Lentisphaerae bacterium]|nr:GntR family transcriptional regulator [Lentisphaerota bacterium]
MEKIESMLAELKSDLASGKFAPDAHFPSEYELAERFKVNKKTANKAVSLLVTEGWLYRGRRGQGTLVSPVKPFPGGQICCISILKNAYQSDFLQGAQSGAFQHDYLLNYCSPPPEELPDLLKRLENSPVRGILTGYYGELNTRLPVIYIDRSSGDPESFYSVSCNNYQGGYEMMKQILARGHRNIVIFFQQKLMRDRLKGFHDAMREAGISDAEKRTFRWLEDSCYEAQKQLRQALKKYPGFTAAACGSDNLMIHTADALDQEGIPWRNRIALTGFGNLLGKDPVLPAASVDQHPFNLGYTAAENLIALIEGRGEDIPKQSMIDVELVNTGNIPFVPQS